MPKNGFFIKNIIVLGDKTGKNGEYHGQSNRMINQHPIIFDDGDNEKDRLERIVEYIIELAQCAAENAKLEQLTRLVTDEFTFYTKNTPLSIDEYKELINRLSEELCSLPPNIVLILSSFAVLWPDGSIRNAVLHIQSPNDEGLTPIMHHFSKQYQSDVDPLYSLGNTYRCYELKADDYSNILYSPDHVLSDTPIQCNDLNQYRSALIVQGHALPPIIEAIEICLDHFNRVALRNVGGLLEQVRNPPLYISHIVSSNRCTIEEENLVATVVHADHVDNQVDGWKEKKHVAIKEIFGGASVALIYHKIRAELLHTNLFAKAVYHWGIPIAACRDNEGNTLLHEIFLRSKTSNPYCTHRARRMASLVNYFDEKTINTQNNAGNTPLHMAVETLYTEALLIDFLQRGARLDIKNNEGFTPIDLAYKYRKTYLITPLLATLENNKYVYSFHRNALLEFLATLFDEKIKQKLIRSSLIFALAENDGELVSALLRLINNPLLFIKNNLLQFARAAAEHKEVYCELVMHHVFEHNRPYTLALAEEIKFHLLKQELSQEQYSPQRLCLFLAGLTTTHTFLNETESELLLASGILVSEQLDEWNQQIVRAYLLKDAARLEPFTELQVEPDAKQIQQLALRVNLEIAEHFYHWIYTTLKALQCQKILITEFQKGTNANAPLLLQALPYGDLEQECGLGNGLTVAEQAIAQILITPMTTNESVALFAIVDFYLDDFILEKIAQSFDNQAEVKTALYQAWLNSELNKGPRANPQIIISLLMLGERIWNNPFNNLPVTLAEKSVEQAYSTNDHEMLDVIYFEWKITGISTDYFLHKFKHNPYFSRDALDWFITETIKLDPVFLIRQEFKKGCQADINHIITALSQEINVEADCGLANGLNIAEQSLAQLILLFLKPEELKYLIHRVGLYLNEQSIIRILNTIPHNENTKDILYIIMLGIELDKLPHVNINAILAALSRGKNVWNASYNADFTFAEYTIIHAFCTNNLFLLRIIYFELKKEQMFVDENKITLALINQGYKVEHVSHWISQGVEECTSLNFSGVEEDIWEEDIWEEQLVTAQKQTTHFSFFSSSLFPRFKTICDLPGSIHEDCNQYTLKEA